jgi:hypothetical protein
MSVYDGFETRLKALAEELRDTDFVAPLRAETFVTMMEEEHPNELRSWMRQHAVAHANDYLTRIFMKKRTRFTSARKFSNAIDRYNDGDEQALNLYTEMVFVVDDGNTRRPLGKMSRDDCNYAANRYSKDVNTLLITEAFLRELGRRVKEGQVVADVLPEVEAAKILASLQGTDFHTTPINTAG